MRLFRHIVTAATLAFTAVRTGVVVARSIRQLRRLDGHLDALMAEMRSDDALNRMRANADADMATRASRRECDRDTLVMSRSEQCGPCDLQFAGRDAPVTVFKVADALERLKAFYLSQGGEA